MKDIIVPECKIGFENLQYFDEADVVMKFNLYRRISQEQEYLSSSNFFKLSDN